MSTPWLDAPSQQIGLPGPFDAIGNVVYVGAWAGRPAASAVPVRSKMIVTDFGAGEYSEWFTDGTNWHPVNGSLLVYQLPAPLIGAAGPNASLTLPVVSFPAGMLFAGCSVWMQFMANLPSVGASVVAMPISIGGRVISNVTGTTTNRFRWIDRRCTLSGVDQYSSPNTSTFGVGQGLSPGGVSAGVDFTANRVDITGTWTVTDTSVNPWALNDYTVFLEA